MADSEIQQLADAMQTPLNGIKFQSTNLTLQEQPPCTRVNIRADFSDDKAVAAIKSLTGISLPLDSNTWVSSADQTLFWLGPDELMLYSTSISPLDLVSGLRDNLVPGKSAVVDVSDYYTVIRVSGDNARQVLASGTPFDVHPKVFGEGQCAQIRFGNASILLSCQQRAREYDLQVRWSFAEYLWGYLTKVGGYL